VANRFQLKLQVNIIDRAHGGKTKSYDIGVIRLPTTPLSLLHFSPTPPGTMHCILVDYHADGTGSECSYLD